MKTFIRHRLRRQFDRLFCARRSGIKRLGGGSGWYVDTKVLNRDSIVYSAGVGRDISFEKALIEKFGMTIELADPSPTGIETMEMAENQSPLIHFRSVGVAAHSGTLKLGAPADAQEGSYTITNSSETIEFPCLSLSDWMNSNQHTHIDLLKMDIEGSEYEVLENIVDNNINIKMICCEFHHFMTGFSRHNTIKSVWKLRSRGYRLIYKFRHDYTFLREKSI